jgi:hypothetical protein
MPALEKMAYLNNFTLISLTKSACPGPSVTKVETGNYKNEDCSEWRKNSFERIQKLKPLAVIVSGMQHFDVPSGYSSRSKWWLEGEAKTISALQGSSEHIIYISDTPHPERDIPSCIAAGNLERCNGTDPSTPYFSPGWERVNPTSWFCTKTCPAIIDGIVVYRDASHISVRASEMVEPKLFAKLRSLGVFK